MEAVQRLKTVSKSDLSTETTLDSNDTDLESSISSLRDDVSVGGAEPTRPHWSSRTGPTSAASTIGKGHTAVISPEVLQHHMFPASPGLHAKVQASRQAVSEILHSESPRLVVVTGPTYISDPAQAKACAEWIRSTHTNPNALVALRANMSHSVGTDSRSSYELHHGMASCRSLLCSLADISPVVGEIADTISPQYFADLYSMGMVSSTFIESQLHREIVSGVSYAVGFGTSDSHLPFDASMYPHKITSASDSMYASSQQHQFLSVTKLGTVAVVGTSGNDETFVVLELNLELTVEQLMAMIEKVYNYKPYTGPKILLDLGQLGNECFEEKRKVLHHILAHARAKIVGVMIDSGDHYTESSELAINATKLIGEL